MGQVIILVQDILTAVENLTTSWCFQKVNGAQEGGFSAARAADDGNHFSLMNGEGDVLEDLVFTVGLFEVFNF